MHINHMRYLVEIEQHNSLNTASQKLHISQQALSRAIRNLEQELDLQLLERTYQGVKLTEQGKILTQFAKETLANFQDTLTLIQDTSTELSTPLTGTLAIYSNRFYSSSVVSETIKGFSQQYPQVIIHSLEDDTSALFQKLAALSDEEQQNSIAIVNAPYDPKTGLPFTEFLPPDGFSFTPFAKGRYLACVSNNSTLAKHKQLSIRTIIKEPLAIFARSDGFEQTPLYFLLQQYGHPNIPFISNSSELWLHAIETNRGLGLLADTPLNQTKLLDSSYLDKVTFIRIKENISLTNGYICGKRQSPQVKAFINLLLQQL